MARRDSQAPTISQPTPDDEEHVDPRTRKDSICGCYLAACPAWLNRSGRAKCRARGAVVKVAAGVGCFASLLALFLTCATLGQDVPVPEDGMTPSDPKGPAHDGNPHEAIQSLLSSADWESRLAVAREQRRLVLEAKAAAQPDTQSRERRSEARGSWETQLDLARTARTEVLAKQAEAIQPEPVVGPVIVAPVLAAPVRPVMPVQEYRPTAAVEKRPSRVWLVVISVALIAVLAGGLLWQQGLLPSFSP